MKRTLFIILALSVALITCGNYAAPENPEVSSYASAAQPDYKTVTINFNTVDVENSRKIDNTWAVVSSQDDTYLVKNLSPSPSRDNKFSITIEFPKTDQYLNVRYMFCDIDHKSVSLKCKLNIEKALTENDITFQYSQGKVSLPNEGPLYDLTFIEGTWDTEFVDFWSAYDSAAWDVTR